ncbi:uncharacterized protein LOC120849872 [Ixodes scapularis]|uniref:uncharacterized protein LOC120849872 n=1 Tax=Ixodes scapularis TaxID=6945 RepID=UPI001A9F9AD7|nr:uncharacterized protein LOC120849872 [Ixodes scapularis]
MAVYADDIAIWAADRGCCRKNVQKELQRALDNIYHFLTTLGLSLSAAKSVALLNAPHRTYKFTLSLQIAGAPVPIVKQATYLGLKLDDRVSWQPAVSTVLKNNKKTTSILRILGGVRRGTSQRMMLQLYHGLIKARTPYALPLLDLNRRQWASLERAQRVALRICLGVPRTASSRHTLVESGTNTVQNAATERALRHLIRMQETPSTVSLVKNIATRRAHLATLVNLLEEIAGCPTTHITLPPPPSERPAVRIEMNIAQMGPKRVTPATVAYQHTSQHIEEFYYGWTRTFTDGSVKAQRRTATAAAISEGHSRMEKLSFHASSTTAELAALRLGLAMTDGKQPGNLVLLTDSRAALRLLEKPDRAPALAREVMAKAQNLQKGGWTIAFQWLPSHCGIEGNEAVDALADRAHDEPNCPISQVPAFADARLLTRRIISARNPELENGPLPAKVPGRLTRNETAVLHRLRTKSAFTPAYLAKWKDHRDDASGKCRVTADDEHLLCVCPLYKQERDELRQTYSALGCPSDTLEALIRPTATAAKAERMLTALAKFLSRTQLCDII